MRRHVVSPTSIAVKFHVNSTSPDRQTTSTVTGFNQLWAMYVRGFNPDVHCQNCLRGQRSSRISRNATPAGVEIVLDETDRYDPVYICGLASGKKSERWFKNLHLPLEHAPGESFSKTLYNGFTVHVSNARLLNFDLLPEGWLDLPREHVRCGNFRFGVRRLGIRARCCRRARRTK